MNGNGPSFHPCSVLCALTLVICLQAAGPRAVHAAPSEDERVAPRVTAIEIDLTLLPERGRIEEEVSLEIAGVGVSELTFEVNRELTVMRSRASEGIVDHRMADDRIHVYLSPPISGTRTLRFKIAGRPRRGAQDLVSEERVVLGSLDRWYPTLSNTWAEAGVTVRAPEGWTVVAPGERIAADAGDVWRWRASKPVRSLAVAGAPGLRLTEDVAVRAPVRVAAPDTDLSAEALAPLLENAMSWFAASLAPYAFDGFNVVFLPGIEDRVRASGMMVLPADTSLSSPSDGADLLAGQWFGERLAGDGVWMEAFAAWYATVFARERSLELPGEIARLREEYFSLPSRRDVPLSRADRLTPAAVVRGKGSAAPDMIRVSIGDRRTQQAIQELFKAPIADAYSLRDVRAVFEKHAGSTLLRAFADWFDRSGAPEFETTLRTLESGPGAWRADLTVQQVRGIYALPVDVVFVGKDREHREVVQLDGERTSVFFILPFQPTSVEIDPSEKLFRRNSG